MSAPFELAIVEPAVLGASVVGNEIATVVRDATGEIVASNLVELSAVTPTAVVAGFAELITSAPFAIDQVIATCARADVRAGLEAAAAAADAPAWMSSMALVDEPVALAEVARREATGMVAVVALDQGGVVADRSVAIVDAATGAICDVGRLPGERSAPVTEAAGASDLATTVSALPAAASASTVLCLGSGAASPEVLAAVAAATGRQAIASASPVFALAQGAIDVLSGETRQLPFTAASPSPAADVPMAATVLTAATAPARPKPGLRWWLIGGAAALAALFFATVALALLAARDSGTTASAVTSTVTVPGTSTEITTGRRVVTATVTEENVVTVTMTPETQTQTERETERQVVTRTVTETLNNTVVESVPPVTVTVPGPGVTVTETVTVPAAE
ncbi:MAG: hypothetical protein QM662_15695 [Gordonia sp. (in: high G+C Gram-positive bacteria)]